MGRYRDGDRFDREGTCDKSWSEIYGSSLPGNLPQNKVSDHIGHSWLPCPYSTQAVWTESGDWTAEFTASYEDLYGIIDRYHYIKTRLGITDYADIPVLVDHTFNNKVVYLRNAYKGVWGFECVFPGCTYYLNNNKRYFYV